MWRYSGSSVLDDESSQKENDHYLFQKMQGGNSDG